MPRIPSSEPGGDDAAATSRVFDIEPWINVTIDGVTVCNGNNVPRGAGIRNRGLLTLSNSVVISNTAPDCGGGIYNWARDVDQRADLFIENSTIINNYEMDAEEGFGGGIYNYAKDGAALAYLSDPLVANNSVVTGGGISNHAVNGYAMFSFSSSTIRENTGLMSSDGIDNRTEMPTAIAELIIEGSTNDGNDAENNGGGLYNESIYGIAIVDLTKTIISYNEAAYGAAVANIALNETAAMTVTNLTISNNLGEVAAGLWIMGKQTWK